MKRLAIRNARLIDPAQGLDETTDAFLAGGKLIGAGKQPEGFAADETLDGAGRILCPGFVDLATRLREPGQEHKGSIAQETRLAVNNGFATVTAYPDTQPVTDNPAVVDLIRDRAAAAGHCTVQVLGALTQKLAGEQLAEMAALQTAGCVGVTNAGYPIKNAKILRRALEYAATLDLTVHLFPVDHDLAADGCAHEGMQAMRMGLPPIPAAAETVALARDLELVSQTGARVHFCRLSTARGVEMIAEAKARGLPVTADVALHQLLLTEDAIDGFNAAWHVLPPLRAEADRLALVAGVADGVIDAICSDHQPHDADAKLAPFPETEPGVATLDGFAKRLLAMEGIPVLRLIEAVTTAPANILGIEMPGWQSLA